MVVRGGLVAVQSLSTLKRETIPFNIQSNEPFSKFLQLLVISKFLSDAFRENTKCLWGCVGGGGGEISIVQSL